jgi:hypothetical protein
MRHWTSLLISGCIFACMAGPPSAVLAQETQEQAGTSQQQEANTNLPRGKKLVMKDGSVLVVKSYEINGERVRYYSTERSDWEQVPTAMIDWDATKRAEAADAEQQAQLVAKVKKEEAEAKAMAVDVDASLEVAPHVFLPPGEGIFLLDGKSIFPLIQSEASSKLNKGRVLEQVLSPIPIIPSRHTVFLKGPRASFRITNARPEFYLRTTDPVEPEVELIAVRVKGKNRQIENIDTLFYQQKEKRKEILMQEWPVAKGIYRFTLGESLKPGEYAVAESTPKEGMNLMVWDFGVDRQSAAVTKSPK